MRASSAAWKSAYDSQMALWRWYRTDPGQEFLRWQFGNGARGLPRNTQELIAKLYNGEEEKVLGASPVFVSADMCQVIAAAAQTFQPEPLLRTDLLDMNCFVYFATPISIIDRDGDDAHVAGFSWMPMFNPTDDDIADLDKAIDEGRRTELLTNWWNDPSRDRRGEGEGVPHGTDGVSLSLYGPLNYGTHTEKDGEEGPVTWVGDAPNEASRPAGMPPLAPMHLTPWWFGMSFDGNQWDEIGQPTGAEWWWRVVQTTLRLMQQRIAHRASATPDRAARREGNRRGFHERDVVVVRLRRERGEHKEPTGEEANYSHRFIVGGHWRNQWYPSAHVHRQIWISPYVKGPEDLPLVVKPRRAYVLNR